MRFKKFENKEEIQNYNGDGIIGTCLQGYLATGIKFKDLYQAFGEPTYNEPSGDDKVQREWVFEYKGNVFTIYDWKTYDLNYTLTEYDRWHVGGKVSADEFIALVEKLTRETACQN